MSRTPLPKEPVQALSLVDRLITGIKDGDEATIAQSRYLVKGCANYPPGHFLIVLRAVEALTNKLMKGLDAGDQVVIARTRNIIEELADAPPTILLTFLEALQDEIVKSLDDLRQPPRDGH